MCACVVIESTIIRGSELVPFVFGFEMLVDALLEVGWLQGLQWGELESPTWKVIIRMGGDGSQSVPVSTASPPQTVASASLHTHGVGAWSRVGVLVGVGIPFRGMSFVWMVKEGKFWKEEKLAELLKKKKSLFQLACLEKRNPNIP